MDKLRVRVYNVRFGDAFLISVPDRAKGGKPKTRHILVDVGNSQSGEGGINAVFEPVIRDVQRATKGRPLDLYVMTHEHMDHVQGPLCASRKFGLDLRADFAWFTGSAAPDYYEDHPDAKKKLAEFADARDAIQRYLATSADAVPLGIQCLMAINNPQRTADCVDYLRSIAPKENTSYVHRGCDLKSKHPFRDATFEVWAPEEDTADYYTKLCPMALAATEGKGTPRPMRQHLRPPPGVDAGAFFNLVESRRHGYVENLLAIDRAANNTSVVFCLEWRGRKLLFPGDAELKSWKTMGQHNLLKPVHFLKVSHHGSANGTPGHELLNKILPIQKKPKERPVAVVSTYPGTGYNGVPDKDTLENVLAARCQLRCVHKEKVPDGEYIDLEFLPLA